MDELGSFLFRRSGRRSFLGAASAAQFHAGPSGGQKGAGVRRGRLFEGLAAREHVPGRDQELAGDRRLRRVLAVARGDPQVVAVPGAGGPPGLVGGLNRRPAKRPRAGLRERPGRRALPRLAHPRGEAGVADQLAVAPRRPLPSSRRPGGPCRRAPAALRRSRASKSASSTDQRPPRTRRPVAGATSATPLRNVSRQSSRIARLTGRAAGTRANMVLRSRRLP